MINWMVAFALIYPLVRTLYAGAHWRRAHHSAWVAVTGREPGEHWVYGQTFAIVLVFGLFLARPSIPSYSTWISYYFDEHSTLFWWVTTVPITLAAALYTTVLTHRYLTGELGAPEQENRLVRTLKGQSDYAGFYKADIGRPLVVQAIFWAWMLLSPTLPFFSCFVRIFLLRQDPSSVLAYY